MKFRSVIHAAIAGAALSFACGAALAGDVCEEGCTPGYWKQDQHFDSWNAPYDPADDFDATFGVDFFTPDISLLDALNLTGGNGGLKQLARAAVAALLNAAEGFYPMTEAEVIAAVAGASPPTYESGKKNLATPK